MSVPSDRSGTASLRVAGRPRPYRDAPGTPVVWVRDRHVGNGQRPTTKSTLEPRGSWWAETLAGHLLVDGVERVLVWVRRSGRASAGVALRFSRGRPVRQRVGQQRGQILIGIWDAPGAGRRRGPAGTSGGDASGGHDPRARRPPTPRLLSTARCWRTGLWLRPVKRVSSATSAEPAASVT